MSFVEISSSIDILGSLGLKRGRLVYNSTTSRKIVLNCDGVSMDVASLKMGSVIGNFGKMFVNEDGRIIYFPDPIFLATSAKIGDSRSVNACIEWLSTLGNIIGKRCIYTILENIEGKHSLREVHFTAYPGLRNYELSLSSSYFEMSEDDEDERIDMDGLFIYDIQCMRCFVQDNIDKTFICYTTLQHELLVSEGVSAENIILFYNTESTTEFLELANDETYQVDSDCPSYRAFFGLEYEEDHDDGLMKWYDDVMKEHGSWEAIPDGYRSWLLKNIIDTVKNGSIFEWMIAPLCDEGVIVTCSALGPEFFPDKVVKNRCEYYPDKGFANFSLSDVMCTILSDRCNVTDKWIHMLLESADDIDRDSPYHHSLMESSIVYRQAMEKQSPIKSARSN